MQLGADLEYIFSLLEPADYGPHWNRALSRSNLSLFRYNNNSAAPETDNAAVHAAAVAGNSSSMGKGMVLEDVHCPQHSDISLVTIIPRCRGVSGLHVYDWAADKWMDAERGAPHDTAVVFTGELMASLSGGLVLPCMHEVRAA